MNKVGIYLKKKREAADLSLREAASLVGSISHQHIKVIEEGTTSPTFEKVMALLQAYHADVQEFMRETGFLPRNIKPVELKKTRQLPLVSWVIAGKWAEVCDNFEAGDADEWIESDVKGEYVFALEVKGDSMEPEFEEDDVIIVRPQAKVSTGDFVVVKNDGGEATLKQIKKIGNRRILHPLNKKYPDIELSDEHEYVVVGKVVEKIKRKRY